MSLRSLGGSTFQMLRKRRRTAGGDVDLTAMIDVVFLLLIFFMVASTMSAQKDEETPEALSGQQVQVDLATFITLLEPREPDTPAIIILGDGVGPEATIDDVQNYIEESGRERIIIKAEKRVPHRDVLAVARQIGEMRGRRLFIGVQELELQ